MYRLLSSAIFTCLLFIVDGATEQNENNSTGTRIFPTNPILQSLWCPTMSGVYERHCLAISTDPTPILPGSLFCSEIKALCCPPVKSTFGNKVMNNVEQDLPTAGDVWAHDCNADSSGNDVLVGLLDKQREPANSNHPGDLDNRRCANYGTPDLVLSDASVEDITLASPGEVTCPDGKVITALWDDDIKYRNVDLAKCMTVRGKFSVDTEYCVDVAVAPNHRQPAEELQEVPWSAQCPTTDAYGITKLVWQDNGQGKSEFTSMKCCKLVQDCEQDFQ